MVGFREQNTSRQTGEARLETPRVAGYRRGMSDTGLIGRGLVRVYDVAADMPRDMGALLRTLDGKVDGTR